MIVESCGVTILGTGSGDIFATDCPAGVRLENSAQKMWARQLDPEGESDTGLVDNAGAQLWILGLKSEGRGIRIRTRDGGKTEVFGMFMYGPGMDEEDHRPMFQVENASLRVMGLREIAFGGPMYPFKVREIRGRDSRTLRSDTEGGWIGWSLYDGWQNAKR